MKLHPSLLATASALLTLLQPCSADTPTLWKGTAAIQFNGTSTLHDWSGTVNAQPFVTTVAMNDSNQPTALKAHVEVKASNMDTKEAKRDENMRKAMRVVDFPLIKGDFDCAFASLLPEGGKVPEKLPFQLSILGKPQAVEARVSNWTQKDGKASFEIDFPLSLKTCGIQVPSVMFVIRVGDTVNVHVNVTLARTQA